MDAFEVLEKKMRKAKTYERPGIIHGVYKQLVYSSTSHRKTQGEYRRYAEASDENREKIGKYVYKELRRYGADNSAKRLYDQVLCDLISHGDLMEDLGISDQRVSPAVVSSFRRRNAY